MADDKTAPIPPIVVTMIDTGTTPGGGSPLTTGTQASTPDHQPNIVLDMVKPVVALVIRFVNVYVGMVVGLLGTAMTSNAIPAPDFWHLIVKCMGLAIGGAVVLMLKDVVTIFGKLERDHPLLTGSV